MSVHDRLKVSASNRSAMISKFGMIPMSILKLGRTAFHKSLFHLAEERGKRTAKGKRAERGGEYADVRLRASGGGSRSADGRAWSVMPADLVAFFAKYYARPGDLYLDPFMGQGVQMQVAHKLGMHYRGYDLCKEFFDFIDAVKSKIDDGSTLIAITHGDSRFPDEIPDGVGDFSFHSPPYWDIEYYGDEPEQLGTGKSYEEFLDGMEAVARAWLPKFKPGATHVVNVNDFRKDGRFYAYHADIISRFCRAGWELHDLWIIEGLVGGLPKIFSVNSNMKRVAPKIHEYAIVFKKGAK
jgi:hypothetical protein